MEERKCGNCINFDINSADKKLIGNGRGYCRAQFGLMLGLRTPNSPCPPTFDKYFIPTSGLIEPQQNQPQGS